MIHFVVGQSSAHTRWCEQVIFAAMNEQPEGARIIRADTPRDLAVELLRRRGESILVTLQQAPMSLYFALRDSERKFVVAYDDPISSLFELTQANRGDVVDAVRTLVSGMANLPLYMSLPNALVLRPSLYAHNLAQIRNHLGLVGPAQTVPLPMTGPLEDATSWWRSLSPELDSMIAGTLGPLLDSKSASIFSWSGSLFWRTDDGTKLIDGAVDITGRARCLLEGPAITVPLGTWRLSLCLVFSEMAVGNTFRVDVSAGIGLGACEITPERVGQSKVSFDFRLGETATGPLIIRVFLLRAAFDGTITFAGAQMAPWSDKS